MAIDRFLAATDLDELLEAFTELVPADAADPRIHRTLAEWNDIQAVANLLMYPLLIAPDEQVAVLRRGLAEGPDSYLCLAAAVGAGQLDAEDLDDAELEALTGDLRAVIAQDDGVVARRAEASLAGLLLPSDAAAARAALDREPLPPLAYVPDLSQWNPKVQ